MFSSWSSKKAKDFTAEEKQSLNEVVTNVSGVNAAFFSKKYTLSESVVHAYVNAPCHKGNNRYFRNKLKDGSFVINNPLIGYRGDLRAPKIIFQEGFSAYHIFGRTVCCPQFFIEIPNIDYSMLPVFLCAIPFYCPIYLACAILADDVSGRSLYKAPFVANWSAVSMSSQYEFAIIMEAAEKKYWRYLIYLNGCINFSEFSHHLVASKKEEFPESTFDAKEIFPRDVEDQTIDTSRIIAAVEINHTKECKRVLETKQLVPKKNIVNNEPVTFLFNRHFSAWSEIQDILKNHGLDYAGQFPKITISPDGLRQLLEERLFTPEPPRFVMS